MDCPRCKRPNAKYKQRRPQKSGGKYGSDKSFKRTDFTIICKSCGEIE